MLADNFRFVIENETGVTIDASKITIKYRGRYFSSDGKLTIEAESSDVANQGSTIADGAYNAGSTVDNGAKASPVLEADVWIEADLSANTATPSGAVTIWLQRATADAPGWPDNGRGQRIAVFAFAGKESQTDVVPID